MEDITRGLLNLDMVMVESATITEAPKVSKAMDITRGLQLLSLDMALLMSMLSRRTMDTIILNLMSMATIFTRGLLKQSLDMDLLMSMLSRRIMDMDIPNPMSMDITSIRDPQMLDTMVVLTLRSTRAVLTTTDLMAMKLIMSIERGLLNLAMAMVVKAISMLTGHTLTTRSRCTILKLITMDMERDLLLLAMVMEEKATSMSTDLILTTRLRFTTLKLTTMDMARDLLNLDMALLMSMLNRRIMDMDTLSLMNMATTSTRGPLMLDMNPTKVTRKFPTPHTPTMRSKCTTLTKCQIEIVPELLIYVNDSYFIRIKI